MSDDEIQEDGFSDKYQSETGVLRTCTLGCTKIANIPKYKSVSDPFLLLVCFVTIISKIFQEKLNHFDEN